MTIKFYKKEKLDKIISKKIKNTNTVLDIGCGIRPQTFITPIVHICAEPFDQYVTKLQEIQLKSFCKNFLIIKSTWNEIVKIIPHNSVDSIFILDVIEHLEKEEGVKLLKETEKIAKNQIVVFTPLGFLPQKDDTKDAWGMDGVGWQEHKSGWSPSDFDESWDLYISKEYHFNNNKGEKYQNPYGAFYAIKNKKGCEKSIYKKYLLFFNLLLNKTNYYFYKYFYFLKNHLKTFYKTK